MNLGLPSKIILYEPTFKTTEQGHHYKGMGRDRRWAQIGVVDSKTRYGF